MSITSNKPATATKSAAPKQNLKAAAPGTADGAGQKGGKKDKVKRVDYPGLTDSEGNAVKLTSIPEDYNPKIHKPLKKTNFADESVFLIARAERLEQMAVKLRKEAETVKNLGSTAQRQSARKLMKMQESMATLMANLSAQGVDVQALLAAVAPKPATTDTPAQG